MMPRLQVDGPRPPSPVTQHWTMWRCAAPVGDGTCGAILTGWERDPVEGPPNRVYRTWEPGPIIRHLPCGHQWWIGQGWLPDNVAPEALGVVRR
jgi:hypothetical protein